VKGQIVDGQLLGGGVRKAFKSKGDDATLTRFVKVGEKHDRKQRRQPRLPGIGTMPYIDEGRTKFTKAVKPVAALAGLLVSGHSNIKLGRDVRKARFRGYWIYSLSLEERENVPDVMRGIGLIATATTCRSPSGSITRTRNFCRRSKLKLPGCYRLKTVLGF
jgi:hypothetical protein